jgi:hypothetical protein
VRFVTIKARAETKLVSALVLLWVAACSTRVPHVSAPLADSTRTQPLTRGVTYQYNWYRAAPWAVHSLIVDPRVCGITLHAAKGRDSMIGREQTSALARRYGTSNDVIAAVNADFFSFDPPGVSEGPQVSNGVLLKSEGAHREALEDRLLRLQPIFAWTRARHPLVMHTRFNGSVTIAGKQLPLAGVNVRPRGDSAFVYTAYWGGATPTDSAALEFVVAAQQVVRVDSSASGVEIPRDGYVIAVRADTRRQVSGVRVGDALSWTGGFRGVPDARTVVGGYPMLLLNGKAVHHDEAGLRTSFSDRRHPRAAIGIARDGRIHIVAVDGRQPAHSDGMTLQELGDYLLSLGITDALNLDGGGSTTLVVRGQIVNRPSDTNGERAVANALLVIDQGRAGSCARTQ